MVYYRLKERHQYAVVLKKVCIISFVFIMMFLVIGCSYHEKEYYSNRDNFLTCEATINNVIHDKDERYLVLWLDDIDEVYSTSDFIIRGDNYDLVIKKGFLDKVKIGDKIIFTSAPRLFGNGYFMPIVEIQSNGEMILSFSEGYENLMKMYN